MFELSKKYRPYLMWLFPLLFFAFQFILRLWPGLMMKPIMTQFSIDATGFGLLAAFYYYGYAGMQIPMAILLEKLGPRKVVFIFSLLCGLSMLLFTCTDVFALAVLSRFLIGAASAAGFLAVSKVISEWFNKNDYAKMVGYSFSFGLLGAIYGGKPLGLLLAAYPWQFIALILSLISIFLGSAAFIALRSPTKAAKIKQDPIRFSDLSVLLRSRPLWCLALANLLMVGALEGFADVWGVPYLMSAYNIDKADAALLISFIFIGMLFGGPVLAALSKKLGHYRLIGACGLGLALAFFCLLSGAMTKAWMLSILFFLVGLMCCYQVIVFAAGSNFVSEKQQGITVAFLNCINMLGGSFFHTIIGQLMDWNWQGSISSTGIKEYNSAVYQQALCSIPFCALLGVALIYLLSQHSSKNQVSSLSVEA